MTIKNGSTFRICDGCRGEVEGMFPCQACRDEHLKLGVEIVGHAKQIDRLTAELEEKKLRRKVLGNLLQRD